MPWDWESYDEFFAPGAGFENPLALDVRVDPAINGDADVLSVYTGTLLIGHLQGIGGSNFKQSSAAWSRGITRFTIPTPGRRWTTIPSGGVSQPNSPNVSDSPFTYFHGGTVVASLASIYNKNSANNAGWAVDGAHVFVGDEGEGIHVEAKIAVRDSDGYLYRLAYQVTALGQGPGPLVGSVSPR
jgi:hypothetical protein